LLVSSAWVSGPRFHLDINEALLGVIDELYAGALDHTRLSAGLGSAARLIGASGGLAYTVYRGEDTIRFGAFTNIDLEALREMGPGTLRSMTQFVQQVPLGQVRSTASIWPIEDMKKSDVYNDILKKIDVMHGAVGLAIRNADCIGGVTLNRSERAGPFSNDQLAALQVLVPHFRNVLQIVNAMGSLALLQQSLAATLDRLSDGVVLADKQGKVLHLNRAAERMLSSNDGLSIRGGRLSAQILEEQHLLYRLIGQAASNQGTDSLERGGTCAISRPSGAPAWVALATPCDNAVALGIAPASPTCIVLIRDRSRRDESGSSQLQRLYGLTNQELKVAIRIAEGHGISEVAKELGLSSLTVRNHLQRVFAKTGVTRQAELARLVANLAI